MSLVNAKSIKERAHFERALQGFEIRLLTFCIVGVLWALPAAQEVWAEEGRAGRSEYTLNGSFTTLDATSSTLFVGQSQHIVAIDIAENVTIGRLYLGRSILHIKVQDTVAFLAMGNGGLVTVDISDPRNLKLLGTVSTGGFAIRLAVQGDHAYISHRFENSPAGDFRVFDEDPSDT